MTIILQYREILNEKLAKNDINIIDIIMEYITKKCDNCKEVKLQNDLEEVCIPHCFISDCKKHNNKKKNRWIDYCETCIDKHCCKKCNDVCCSDCDNKFICDVKNCNNIFCEDCIEKEMLYCKTCDKHFCCRKLYRTIDDHLDYQYTCEDCIKVILPKY